MAISNPHHDTPMEWLQVYEHSKYIPAIRLEGCDGGACDLDLSGGKASSVQKLYHQVQS